MLQNVTLLAIVAIHTAANEPPKVRQVMNKIRRNVEFAASRRTNPQGLLAVLSTTLVETRARRKFSISISE